MKFARTPFRRSEVATCVLPAATGSSRNERKLLSLVYLKLASTISSNVVSQSCEAFLRVRLHDQFASLISVPFNLLQTLGI